MDIFRLYEELAVANKKIDMSITNEVRYTCQSCGEVIITVKNTLSGRMVIYTSLLNKVKEGIGLYPNMGASTMSTLNRQECLLCKNENHFLEMDMFGQSTAPQFRQLYILKMAGIQIGHCLFGHRKMAIHVNVKDLGTEKKELFEHYRDLNISSEILQIIYSQIENRRIYEALALK